MTRMIMMMSMLGAMILVGCSQTVVKGGKPEITSAAAIRPLMKRTFEYQVSEQAKKQPDGGWIRAAFYTGVVAAYRATDDKTYLNQAMKWAAEQGKWQPHPGNLRFADNYCNAQVYCELYELKHDPKMIEASRENFDRIMADPKPGRVDWWWCDALYMGPPGWVRMSAVTGDGKYADFAGKMYRDTAAFLYRPEYHLFFRDKNYFNKKCANGKPVFWSRGNGWVLAGLARILQYLPADHPDRGWYETLFKEMSAELVGLQGADGMWRSSLLDAEEFPEPETSGTAFFTFAMAYGINHDLLDRGRYLPHVIRGYAGLCAMVDQDGKLTHVQKVAGAPGKVNPRDTHEYAVGAFLQASAEMLKLKPSGEEEKEAMEGYHPPAVDR